MVLQYFSLFSPFASVGELVYRLHNLEPHLNLQVRKVTQWRLLDGRWQYKESRNSVRVGIIVSRSSKRLWHTGTCDGFFCGVKSGQLQSCFHF